MPCLTGRLSDQSPRIALASPTPCGGALVAAGLQAAFEARPGTTEAAREWTTWVEADESERRPPRMATPQLFGGAGRGAHRESPQACIAAQVPGLCRASKTRFSWAASVFSRRRCLQGGRKPVGSAGPGARNLPGSTVNGPLPFPEEKHMIPRILSTTVVAAVVAVAAAACSPGATTAPSVPVITPPPASTAPSPSTSTAPAPSTPAASPAPSSS